MNIALISPNKNAYSETFIQAHKELLEGDIFYYFDGKLPKKLEGGIVINSRRKRITDIFKGHFRLNRFSLEEQALITSFRTNKIDVVFAEYGGAAQKILPLSKEMGLPLIVHFHGYDASRKQVLEENNYYQEVFDYAKYIVVVSKKMYGDLISMGCLEGKLVYNTYGPREEFLKITPKFYNQQFIALGRFVDKKAPYYLIYSFRMVLEKFPEAKLIMAGEGSLLNTCKNLVKFYRLEASVEFPGVISQLEFRQYLEESLAFIQHSITADDGDSEGTPVSILEASAAGLPVVSTYHAGIPDVIESGKTGLLVEEHDVQGMAENMIKLIENVNWAKKMGENGRSNIEQNFSLQRHIDILNDLIKGALRK